jgi:RecA-family ATPase
MKREFIAEGFLNEKSCLIIAADPGTGKSVISLQAALQLSAGLPLFGAFEVKRPYRCYYIQKERPKEEIGERIEYMQKYIKWNPDYFILDDQLQAFNLSREANWPRIIERILVYSPEIIFIDPIYAGTPGLSKDETASAFTAFLTMLEAQTGASVWLNHHTTKESHDREGNVIEKSDPMYGSVWIKAHVTAAFHMSRTDDGIHMKKLKDSHLNLVKSLDLEFDPESYISTAKGEWGEGSDRLLMFINRMEKLNQTFNIDEIVASTNLSQRSIVRHFGVGPFKDRVKNLSINGKKGLYKVITP